MLVSDLRREIEYILQDTVDPDHLTTIFNECLREDLAHVLRLETKATITLATDETTVSYPDDIYEIILLKAQGKSQVRPQTIDEIPLTDECSSGYTFFGGVIELHRMEDTPYTLFIWYYRYPAEITGLSDKPDMPSQYHHALKHYFLAKHFEDDSMFNEAQVHWNNYLKVRNQIDNAGRKSKGAQRPRRVRTVFWR